MFPLIIFFVATASAEKPMKPLPTLNDTFHDKINSILREKHNMTQRAKFKFNIDPKQLPKKPVLRKWPRYRNPNIVETNTKIYGVMMQAIYTTKERLEDIEILLQTYTRDVRFVMAMIFCKLDKLQQDIEELYTHSARHWWIRVWSHIIYYNHGLRKNVDITYTVEYVIALHTKIMRIIKDKEGESKTGGGLELGDDK